MSSIWKSVSALSDSSCLRRWLEPKPRGPRLPGSHRSYKSMPNPQVETGLLIQLVIIRNFCSPPIGTINLLKVWKRPGPTIDDDSSRHAMIFMMLLKIGTYPVRRLRWVDRVYFYRATLAWKAGQSDVWFAVHLIILIHEGDWSIILVCEQYRQCHITEE